ncbi:MAG: hypothetical protein SH850_21710 [Planctomycetaceae bacterium]|nr:hypothetical protein [Planctomycetaceae bacterium]
MTEKIDTESVYSKSMSALLLLHECMIASLIASHPNPTYLKAIFTVRFKPETMPEEVRGLYSMHYEKHLHFLEQRIEEMGGQ